MFSSSSPQLKPEPRVEEEVSARKRVKPRITVNSDFFRRTLFLQIALIDIFAMLKIRD